MCNFFSFVEQSNAQRYYFNWEQRQSELRTPSGQLIDEYDSHSEICAYYNLNVDKVNKYEFNPLTRNFKVDQLNTKDHSKSAEKWANKLDFKTIVEPLVIKPIIDVEKDPVKVTNREIELLRNWVSISDSISDSVRASVSDSIRDSIWDSVSDSVSDSVWVPVWVYVKASIKASIRDSVSDSIRDSIWDSAWAYVRVPFWAYVRDSIWDSVWNSIEGYFSSFFKIKRWKGFEDLPDYENPFQSVIDLMENGLIPSFDGEIWRLHAINSGKIVYEEKKKCRNRH